mgnify:CR=1 FL=1
MAVFVANRVSMMRLKKNIRWFIDHAGSAEVEQMGHRGHENLIKNLTREESVRKYAEEILEC